MKPILTFLAITVLSLPVSAPAQSAPAPAKIKGFSITGEIDTTARCIFYSVLEGLYEDGLNAKDVDQILMRKKEGAYFHFIYACPVCGPTIWALEAYRGRPEKLYGLKRDGSTFGKGLSPELHEQLYSEEPSKRLTAINTLVKGWLERRINSMNLSKKDRAALLKSLEEKRKEGMNVLKSFKNREGKKPSEMRVEDLVPAFVDIDECAVCNGAVGKPNKLPEAKPHQ